MLLLGTCGAVDLKRNVSGINTTVISGIEGLPVDQVEGMISLLACHLQRQNMMQDRIKDTGNLVTFNTIMAKFNDDIKLGSHHSTMSDIKAGVHYQPCHGRLNTGQHLQSDFLL
ncbi:hypothetical protein SAY87_009615 [Trapa incisa]|uniref:Uncharacterized protein n=1 Tax=Trapa incisa TaxID=236973 RepID=A0AAN7K200_9MYRT|nr:hypothetical protein SAY87_009615 [Trapa incisa]